MTGIEQKICMAYAIGFVDSQEAVNQIRTIDLGEVNPDWKDYRLLKYVRCKDENDRISLGYYGDYGVEKKRNVANDVLNVYGGLDVEHMIHLFIQAITVHQAEVRRTSK